MYSLEEKKKKRKRWELIVVTIFIIWLILFLIDYVRYQKSKPPLITISVKEKVFEDGSVKEYYSLGYVFREYKRKAIGQIELKPIWVEMQNPDPIGEFPLTYTDYNVPENPTMAKKYKSLLYFYDNLELIGTYKCINTSGDCINALSGEDNYNIDEIDELNRLETKPMFYVFDKHYAFIEDSLKQEHASKKQFKKTIYLFDIEANKIIGEYSDIRYSLIDEETGYATGSDNNFIVMNSAKKWGLINVTEGEIKEVLPFEYESINYNKATGMYIVKKEKWSVLDLERDVNSSEFSDIIVDLYPFRNSLVIETAQLDYENNYNFKVSNLDGTTILEDSNIIQISFQKGFIIYVDNKYNLSIIDYDGKKLVDDAIRVFSNEFYETYDHVPAYKVEQMVDDSIKLTISRKKISDGSIRYNVYYYNPETWEKIGEYTDVETP